MSILLMFAGSAQTSRTSSSTTTTTSSTSSQTTPPGGAPPPGGPAGMPHAGIHIAGPPGFLPPELLQNIVHMATQAAMSGAPGMPAGR